MRSRETGVIRLLGTGSLQCLFVLIVIAFGHLVGVAGLDAQETWSIEFTDDGAAPTFRAESQAVTVREAMGAVLVTAESFRLLTDFTDSLLAGCSSTRPDLPDARIQPEEIRDRVGSLSLAVFEDGKVNFTFRTITGGTEYAITMNGSGRDAVQVTRADSGELVLSGTETPLSVIRNKAEMFYCNDAAHFTIRLSP